MNCYCCHNLPSRLAAICCLAFVVPPAYATSMPAASTLESKQSGNVTSLAADGQGVLETDHKFKPRPNDIGLYNLAYQLYDADAVFIGKVIDCDTIDRNPNPKRLAMLEPPDYLAASMATVVEVTDVLASTSMNLFGTANAPTLSHPVNVHVIQPYGLSTAGVALCEKGTYLFFVKKTPEDELDGAVIIRGKILASFVFPKGGGVAILREDLRTLPTYARIKNQLPVGIDPNEPQKSELLSALKTSDWSTIVSAVKVLARTMRTGADTDEELKRLSERPEYMYKKFAPLILAIPKADRAKFTYVAPEELKAVKPVGKPKAKTSK